MPGLVARGGPEEPRSGADGPDGEAPSEGQDLGVSEKYGVPCLGVLIIRILLFRVLYYRKAAGGSPSSGMEKRPASQIRSFLVN